MSLISIVTGLEHSGTTFLSNLILCHPKVNAGFECGVLLADSPSNFINIKPFYEWMQSDWGLKAEDMVKICNSGSWSEMYKNIILYSPIFKNKSNYILDKTPRYMLYLDEILDKTTAPCIVIKKQNILFQYQSYKNRNVPLHKFIERYLNYMNGYIRARKKFEHRIYTVEYEKLYSNIIKEIGKVYEFINLDFKETYLTNHNQENLKPNFNYKKEVLKIDSLTNEEKSILNSFCSLINY